MQNRKPQECVFGENCTEFAEQGNGIEPQRTLSSSNTQFYLTSPWQPRRGHAEISMCIPYIVYSCLVLLTEKK